MAGIKTVPNKKTNINSLHTDRLLVWFNDYLKTITQIIMLKRKLNTF